MAELGKIVILAGVILVIVGLMLTFFDRVPFLGKLPGDIHIKRDNFQLHFPLMTSILLSIVLTAVFWLLGVITRR